MTLKPYCWSPKVVVAVVAVGNDQLYQITIPTIENWCKLHKYRFERISTVIPYSSPYWAKFKAYDFFEKHGADCVVLLDADILIKPGSPSPVCLKPQKGVHAANSLAWCYGMREQASEQQDRFIEVYKRATGVEVPKTDFYINGGVCVVWKDARDFLAPPLHESLVSTGPNGAFDDQNLMNARCYGRYTQLPLAFNCEQPQIPANLERMKNCDIWFVHLNTPGDKVGVAKEILRWSCFSKASARWWLRCRPTASVWHQGRAALFRTKNCLKSLARRILNKLRRLSIAPSAGSPAS
jgi:hypothetical protein